MKSIQMNKEGTDIIKIPVSAFETKVNHHQQSVIGIHTKIISIAKKGYIACIVL